MVIASVTFLASGAIRFDLRDEFVEAGEAGLLSDRRQPGFDQILLVAIQRKARRFQQEGLQRGEGLGHDDKLGLHHATLQRDRRASVEHLPAHAVSTGRLPRISI